MTWLILECVTIVVLYYNNTFSFCQRLLEAYTEG